MKGYEEREIRSSLLILELKDGKLEDSGKEVEGKTFHKLHVLGMNDDWWDRIQGLGSKLVILPNGAVVQDGTTLTVCSPAFVPGMGLNCTSS